jgi:hypothetical protein
MRRRPAAGTRPSVTAICYPIYHSPTRAKYIGVPELHFSIHSMHRPIFDNDLAQFKAVTFVLDMSHQSEMVGLKH